MADFDPVEIVVEIINRAESELDKIDRQFQELKAKHGRLGFDLDIRTNGEISRTNQQLNYLSRDRFVDLWVRKHVLGLNQEQLQRAWSGARLSAPQLEFGLPSNAPDLMNLLDGNAGGSVPSPSRRRFRQLRRSVLGFLGNQVRLSKNLGGQLESITGALVPSYHQIVTIIAALVPMLITLAVQAMGVATAFAAIGVAGVGAFGLGLLGQADTLEGSIARSRQLLGEFRDKLYETFRPAATLFAPFTESFLTSGASLFQPLADAAQTFQVFEDSAISGFRGLIEWAAEGLTTMAQYEPMIEGLSDKFGGAVGSAIINFFKFVTEEAYANQDLLMRLGRTFVTILAIIYNLSTAISRIVVILEPVFTLLAGITDLLNSRFVAAIGVAIVAAYAFSKAIAAVAAAKAFLLTLSGGGIPLVAAGFGVSAGVYSALTGPTEGDARFNDSVTPSGLSGGGTTVNNTVVVQGDVSQKHIREWETMWDGKYSEERSFESGMSGASF